MNPSSKICSASGPNIFARPSLPVQVLEDHQAAHIFYHLVFFSLTVCVWEPYKLFEGVNAGGESGGAVGVSGLCGGATDHADGPKRR